tara:strand:- start:62317 stop:62658 length:342 start_codon:yes stop_codon:yes gene_type:complete
MIYQNITETMFKDSFHALRPDNFSYAGLSALYHYLTDMSEDCGDIELDVIAICCDFSEENYVDIMDNYGVTLSDVGYIANGDRTRKQAVADWLSNETLVVAVLDNGNIVYQVF